LHVFTKGLIKIGQPELEHDPRFAEAATRTTHQAELIAIIDAWLLGFSDNAAVLDHLERHRVPAAPVLNPIDALDHPYFAAREMVKHIEDPILGPMSIPGTQFRFPAQPERPDRRARIGRT
jgi:formyl-CoA transferase